MNNTPDHLRYATSHEWVLLNADGTVSVGITDHAQEALGDIVYLELPALNSRLERGQQAGIVESVKAASDIYAPIGGTVIEVNDTLTEAPEGINSHPYDSWFYKLQPADVKELEQLLDAAGYQASV
ncbi:glycine cleavage system protein GcvH [Thiopseudomonas alkaliphila]|mgnify:FL=1|uniref:glycine cleavage system protein GcvH n=1 Tax=Thiopseudomonas alkaliphila TaxID=1697053 RepID=UPI002577CE5E|nr:glycine cleavage system protein GcvH [Thiopseudomonas alkaliphila]MDM1708710.1 glycine cleavage system protein GcvH [Thiopseudomonas alkaliphila]